ncbi:MAG: CUB domain-containing protein [Bacteroidetes bacterium]|nr:CUB domain-containing protein [Bacteroidota bacterium]
MPLFNDQVLTACTGVLTDDGGPDDGYAPGLSAKLTIAPPGATSITLTFSQFAWETGLDYLDIYEGPDTLGPSLGAWTGELLPPTITSATGAITLQQRATSAQAGWPGFIATWECTTLGIGDAGGPMIAAVWPQPADGPVTVSFRDASTAGWRIAIHNALGAKIMDHGLQGGTQRYTFDTGAWSPGCYVLTLDTGHGRWSRAIVVR